MRVNMIWSTDPNGYIGTGTDLIFINQEDTKHFREVTTGSGNNAVVMGRRTYESIGNALPDRLNLVLTKNREYTSKDVIIAHSIIEVLNQCKEHNIEELWVVGGKEIYQQFIELAERLVITKWEQYALPYTKYIQYLPDLSDFTLIHSKEIKTEPAGSINYYVRRD